MYTDIEEYQKLRNFLNLWYQIANANESIICINWYWRIYVKDSWYCRQIRNWSC